MQADFSVSDGTGQEVLDDINLQIQALATSNSGAGEPPTLYEGMVWYDTTNKTTWRRNSTGGWDKMISEKDAIKIALVYG